MSNEIEKLKALREQFKEPCAGLISLRDQFQDSGLGIGIWDSMNDAINGTYKVYSGIEEALKTILIERELIAQPPPTK